MNKILKITDEQLIEVVKIANSFSDVLRKLGIRLAGGSHSHYKKRIKTLNLDTSHFRSGKNWNLGKPSTKRKKSKDVLILRQSGSRTKHYILKRVMIEEGIEHKCSQCNLLPNWNGQPLTLDVDHINENWLDDRIENLRFLCPNCHSQYTRKLLRD